jgi:hypothetical protein
MAYNYLNKGGNVQVIYYANCRDKVKTVNRGNTVTELSQSTSPGDKLIHTKDWGSFKVRKNGRIWLHIGDEIIRVQQYKGVTNGI